MTTYEKLQACRQKVGRPTLMAYFNIRNRAWVMMFADDVLYYTYSVENTWVCFADKHQTFNTEEAAISYLYSVLFPKVGPPTVEERLKALEEKVGIGGQGA